MPHPYDEIIAETDPQNRTRLLINEFRKVIVPRATESLNALLEKLKLANWESDPDFFGDSSKVEDIGDGWWMCTECSDAFEAQPGVCHCPSCQKPLLAHGLQLTVGPAWILLVPWTENRTAVRVEAGSSFFGIPSAKSVEWKTALQNGKQLDHDAWVIALLKTVLNEDELRHGDIDASNLLDVFPLEKDGGYYKNDEFINYIQTAQLDELDAITEVIKNSFSFLPGSSFCPEWLDGERLDGSPLMILESLMTCVKKQSLSHYNYWVGVLLRYVLADNDVFYHDERAMSRNMADDFIKVLITAPEDDFDNVSLELLLSSIERSVKSATGVEYGVDLFGLMFHLLSWNLSSVQRDRIISAIIDFSGIYTDEEIDVLAVYIETNVISSSQIASYANLISDLPEATNGSPLASLAEKMRAY